MSNQEIRYLIKNELEYLYFIKPKSLHHLKTIFNKYKYFITNYNDTENKSLQYMIYNYVYNYKNKNICEFCGSPKTKFIGFSYGFRRFCNNSCSRRYVQKEILLKIIKDKNLSIEKSNIKETIKTIYSLDRHFSLSNPLYELFKTEIDKYVIFLGDVSASEKLYCFVNNISEKDIFCYCGKKLKYDDFNRGYSKFCGIKCAINSQEVKEKINNTLLNNNNFTFSMNIYDDIKSLKKIIPTKYIRLIYDYYKKDILEYTTFLPKNSTYVERLYCYLKCMIDIPKCLNCNKVVKFNDFQSGYFTYCSQSCSAINTLEKREQTTFERFGVKNILQHSDIKNKIDSNNGGFKFKDYIFPSGRKEKIQGYENCAIDILLNEMNYNENDIVISIDEQPEIWYEFENKQHRHYLDIFIPKENKIIEVKSTWTYEIETDKILSKKQSCEEYGYIYEIWIIDKQKLINIL